MSEVLSSDIVEVESLPTADQKPPRSAVDDLVQGGVPSPDLDPLADGILMKHQKEWIADQSDLKIADKGRRTGFTFAEALDSTLIAAQKVSDGGDSSYYIGDTKDKGLEFIATCANFARHVAKEMLAVDEFLFDDVQPDGTSKMIAAYRIKFASGNMIVALSSNPANIRGLQGRVIIDEAAFHRNVAAVIDACNALLIWGGVIRIISSHNGVLNAFNELLTETRAGSFDYSIHRATFDTAVANGLYERVCLKRGWTPTVEAKEKWYLKIRRSYGNRLDAMREELDAIPREGDGVLLPLAWIEACSTPEYKVLRWEPPFPGFVDMSEDVRRAEMLMWLTREALPIIARYHNQDLEWFMGGDFAMRQDRSSYPFGFVGQDLKRHVPFLIELRQCPYDQQKQTLFWVVEQLELIGRFGGGVLDANGNGMVLAQESRQRFGADRIVELMPNDAWSREFTPLFRAAFEDRTFLIPADIDTRNDLRQLVISGGVARVPRHIRTEGSDGGKRHGDNAVAIQNFHAATKRGGGQRWAPLIHDAAQAPSSQEDEDWIPAW